MESVAELLERGRGLQEGTSYGLTADDEALPVWYDAAHLQWWLAETRELLHAHPDEAKLFASDNILASLAERDDPVWLDDEIIAGWEKALALLADVQQKTGLT